MARPCDTLPKKWCAASIISLDEYWFAVGGGNGGWKVGAGGGIVPVVWAITDMDATTAITLAILVVLDASTPDHRHCAQQQRCRKHNCDNLWPHLRGAADPSAWYLHVVLWRDSDSNFLQTKQ